MTGRLLESVEKPDADHVFINATLFNDSPVISPTQPYYIPASISQTRSSAIVNNPSEWNFTIVRLTVNSSAIPRITESVSSLVVGYSFNNVFYDAPVTIPLAPDLDTGLPTQSLYDVYSFVNIVNNAFFTAQTAAAGGGAVFAYGQVFLHFSPETQLFSLYIPSYFGEGTVSTDMTTIGVHMSFDMSQRIDSFPTIQNVPLQNNGHDVTFVKKFSGLNQVTLPATTTLGPGGPVVMTGNYMLLQQDSAWPSSIENVNRVAVTTGTIPVITEYRTTALFSQNGGGNNQQSAAILTDFIAGINAPLANRSEPFTYIPDPYRLSSMTTNQPLLRYDITVNTVDRFGVLNVLRIPPGGNLDVKLLFLKKGLSN